MPRSSYPGQSALEPAESPRRSARILVVEDEPALRTDLADYLTSKGYTVEVSATAGETLRQLARAMPDIVVLDLGLPDGDGMQIAADIRRRFGFACAIVMLTAYADADHRVQGMRTGADLYLTKSASLREIEACCAGVWRRLQETPASIRRQPAWTLSEADWRLVAPGGQSVELTATEMQFLSALMIRAGAVCPRRTLGPRANSRNLDATVRRLRRKIETVCGEPSPFKTVYGRGYVFTAPARRLSQDQDDHPAFP